LIVYSFEDYFQQLLSFFCQQHPFFSLFKRFTHFALVESTAASTLAAAVSTASPILFYCAVASSTLSLVSFLQNSTKVATRANPKMLSSCFVF
jgi:hypothetical protein